MPVIRCNVCLGMTELPEGMALANCSFCGSQITAPVTTDKQPDAEMYAAAFDRGNHFHRIGEFDKALAVFERIILEDETNAQAHWACALCRFGIEFVEDPVTHAFLPTCHRASYDSFLEDVDYIAALKYADDQTRPLYEHWGSQIAQVLRSIISISQQEEPFDVFLCYKETGADGQRTRDSQLAQDIYYELTDEGLRVFFARITLEDRPGVQYEPYIFSALNSAKVMVVVGTRPEHLNAVWVKNEWSRFLSLMKNDRQRLLIPCYRDMDPYDMPEQLSILQSYDMSRIGFAQDLIRGISKVVNAGKEEDNADDEPAAPSVESLLRRVTLFLEDGDWGSANIYCEKVLDIDPECARAYLGKLMAALKVHKQEDLHDLPQAFAGNLNYQKVLRFADTRLAEDLQAANKAATERHRHAQLEAAYQKASTAFTEAAMQSEFTAAQKLFEELGDYRDATSQAALCAEKAEETRKDAIYHEALTTLQRSSNCSRIEEAIQRFQEIPGWRDTEERIAECRSRIEEIRAREKRAQEQKRAEEELERARQKSREEADRLAAKRYRQRELIVGILKVAAVVVPIAALLIWFLVIVPNNNYNAATALKASGQYEEASDAFKALGDYKDSAEQTKQCHYLLAERYFAAGDTAMAAIHFGKADDYKDAHSRSMNLWNNVTSRDIIDATEDCILGIKPDGTVVIAGEDKDVSGWRNIVEVAVSGDGVFGLRSDGTVVHAGTIYFDEEEIAQWRNIVSIETEYSLLLGIKKDGTVVTSGSISWGNKRTISKWTNVVTLDAGDACIMGIRSDGTVVTASDTLNDKICSEWEDIVAVAAGGRHYVGLKADGTVVAGGLFNNDGEQNVSGWRDIVDIAASSSQTIGLKADGTLVYTGYRDKSFSEESAGWKNIVDLVCDYRLLVCLRSDGTVVANGDYDNGQLSVSSWRLKTIPRPTLHR